MNPGVLFVLCLCVGVITGLLWVGTRDLDAAGRDLEDIRELLDVIRYLLELEAKEVAS